MLLKISYFAVEINECSEGTDDCHQLATCINTPPGSYSCECNPGACGDGFACFGKL